VDAVRSARPRETHLDNRLPVLAGLPAADTRSSAWCMAGDSVAPSNNPVEDDARCPPTGDSHREQGSTRREHEVVPIRAEVVRTAGRRRVAVGQEKPHPSVQRRYADLGGYRIPALAANTPHAASGPTSNLGTAPSPRRRPQPHRQRHRPDQPALYDGPEPDLVRHRRSRRRADRTHAGARPDRRRRACGNENADGYGCCSSSPGGSPTTGEPNAVTSLEPHPEARLLAEVIAGCERSPPPRASNPASSGPPPSSAAGTPRLRLSAEKIGWQRRDVSGLPAGSQRIVAKLSFPIRKVAELGFQPLSATIALKLRFKFTEAGKPISRNYFSNVS